MPPTHDLIDEYLLVNTGMRAPLFGSHARLFVPRNVDVKLDVLPDAYHPQPCNRFTTPIPLLLYDVPTSWYPSQEEPPPTRDNLSLLTTPRDDVSFPPVWQWPSQKVCNSLTDEEEESFRTWRPIKHWCPRAAIDALAMEAIGWQWRNDTEGLLDDVIALAQAEHFTEQCYEAIKAFVCKWGPLWSCRNATHAPCYVPRLLPWRFESSPCSWAPVEEAYEFWRHAWEVRAVLEIGQDLRKGRLAKRVLSPHLRFVGDDWGKYPNVSLQRLLLAVEVRLHLNPHRGGVELDLTWEGTDTSPPTLALCGRMGFLHAAWMQVAQLLCKAHGISRCDRCKEFYVRTGRKPQQGRRNFCPGCRGRDQQGKPRNLGSKQLSAQHTRAAARRAQQLHEEGARIKDIAQQLGTDVAKVQKWIGPAGPPTRRGPGKARKSSPSRARL